MSNYTKATNFAAKDALPVGDANKKVKGVEIDNEFNALANAVSTKSDSNSPTFTGIPAAPTATVGTNTTQLATTAFVNAEIANDSTPPTREVIAGSGLTGGGDLSADRTLNVGAGTGITVNADDIAITATGVSANTYGSATAIPVIGVNAQGQITSATTASVTVPTLTHFTSSTSIGNGTTYNLPTDAFMLSGTSYHQMNGSTGSRLDIQVYTSTGGSGTLIDTYICGGGNEGNGTDGGSGMSTRDSWTVLLPANARSVKFVKGAGSAGFSGNIESGMKFTNYHS